MVIMMTIVVLITGAPATRLSFGLLYVAWLRLQGGIQGDRYATLSRKPGAWRARNSSFLWFTLRCFTSPPGWHTGASVCHTLAQAWSLARPQLVFPLGLLYVAWLRLQGGIQGDRYATLSRKPGAWRARSSSLLWFTLRCLASPPGWHTGGSVCHTLAQAWSLARQQLVFPLGLLYVAWLRLQGGIQGDRYATLSRKPGAWRARSSSLLWFTLRCLASPPGWHTGGSVRHTLAQAWSLARQQLVLPLPEGIHWPRYATPPKVISPFLGVAYRSDGMPRLRVQIVANSIGMPPQRVCMMVNRLQRGIQSERYATPRNAISSFLAWHTGAIVCHLLVQAWSLTRRASNSSFIWFTLRCFASPPGWHTGGSVCHTLAQAWSLARPQLVFPLVYFTLLGFASREAYRGISMPHSRASLEPGAPATRLSFDLLYVAWLRPQGGIQGDRYATLSRKPGAWRASSLVYFTLLGFAPRVAYRGIGMPHSRASLEPGAPATRLSFGCLYVALLRL